MTGIVEDIYIATRGGAAMQRVDQVEALAGRGLAGDRYCEKAGYWTGVDECQVTLIRAEDLDETSRRTGVRLQHGEHRRNFVVRGLDLKQLAGQQFRIGEAVLQYDRPRPPCSYIASITEPGMTKALARCGGICAVVLESGVIRSGDEIHILDEQSQ